MARDGDSLPGDWASTENTGESGLEIRQFQLDRNDDATFLVWVLKRDVDSGVFETRLTTISKTGNRVRHDYPIDTYATEETAIDEAKEFVERLETRISSGALSAADPSIEEVQSLIDEFTGVGITGRLRRFLGQIGQ